LAFALGLPFGAVAVLQHGRTTARVLVTAFLGSVSTLAASLGLTWLFVQLDVL
jgi:hypothetical protein